MQQNISATEFGTLLFSLLSKYYRIERNDNVCCGLSISQYQILDILDDKDFVKMNELGLKMGLAVSTVTRLVDVMLKHDWVERGVSAEDRRVVTVNITNAGKTILTQINNCRDKLAKEILGGIPREKQPMVYESLSILGKSFGNCCK